VQPRYNLLFRQIERELLPLAVEEGVGVIPYNPLAGGLLTGKHRLQAGPPEGRFQLGTAAKTYQDRYWHEREFATVEELRGIASAGGIALPQAAIAWVLAHPAVTSAIIGASRASQLNDTLSSADVTLDADLKKRFDELTHTYRWGDASR
jgi:aryl-alcohol dehydrogenase-like predicted oxidoreductase